MWASKFPVSGGDSSKFEVLSTVFLKLFHVLGITWRPLTLSLSMIGFPDEFFISAVFYCLGFIKNFTFKDPSHHVSHICDNIAVEAISKIDIAGARAPLCCAQGYEYYLYLFGKRLG